MATAPQPTPPAPSTPPRPGDDVDPALLDPGARVVLLGKPGCHLCEVARDVVDAVCADLEEPVVHRSTLDDVAWEMRYWEFIPVLFVDGRPHSYWRVDADALRADLQARPAGAH